MKKLLLKMIALALVAAAVNPALAEWEIDERKDEISGVLSAYAFSSKVSPTKKMRFPYNEVYAQLAVACDSEGDTWSYIWFSGLNSRDEVLRTKWGEEQVEMRVSGEPGDDALYFTNNNLAFDLIGSSPDVIVGVDWYSQGERFFKWDLKGSAAAIQEMERRCGL